MIYYEKESDNVRNIIQGQKESGNNEWLIVLNKPAEKTIKFSVVIADFDDTLTEGFNPWEEGRKIGISVGYEAEFTATLDLWKKRAITLSEFARQNTKTFVKADVNYRQDILTKGQNVKLFPGAREFICNVVATSFFGIVSCNFQTLISDILFRNGVTLPELAMIEIVAYEFGVDDDGRIRGLSTCPEFTQDKECEYKKLVQDRYNIPLDNIFVLGDGKIDIPMMKESGGAGLIVSGQNMDGFKNSEAVEEFLKLPHSGLKFIMGPSYVDLNKFVEKNILFHKGK